MLNSELVQSYARRILYWLSGALVSHGVVTADASWIEPTIGALVTLITFAWSLYGDRLNGLLARVQAKDGVQATNVVVDPDKIDPRTLAKNTPDGVSAIPAAPAIGL